MADVRRGRIQRLVRGRGYGFIESREGQMVFFHRDDLIGIPFERLQEGMEVEFLFNFAERGSRAKDVRPLPPPAAESRKPEGHAADPAPVSPRSRI